MSGIEKTINQRAALLQATGKAPTAKAAWMKADLEMEAAFNLYQSHNVKGITQAQGQAATVYYQNASHHGRLTQEHNLTTNVGLDFPHSNVGYSARNEMVRHRGENAPRPTFVERQDGHVTHTSRNAFQPTGDATDQRVLHALSFGSSFKPKEASIQGRLAYLQEKADL